jgi:proton glutamate symport protein
VGIATSFANAVTTHEIHAAECCWNPVVMFFAPIGVFGSIAYTVGHMGLGVLLPLAKLLATMYVALVVFVVLVLLPIALLVRVLGRFLRAVAEPVTIAFATASSEAALPRAMEQMERFGVDRETVAFVLPPAIASIWTGRVCINPLL